MRKPSPEDYDPKYKPNKAPAPEPVDLSDVVPIKARADRIEPGPPPVKEAQPDDRPEIRPDHRAEIRSELRSENRSEDRTEKRSETTPPPLPIKRRTKRCSFEFYDDQLVRLRQLKIQAEMRGQGLSLSAMVRAALDAYLSPQDQE